MLPCCSLVLGGHIIVTVHYSWVVFSSLLAWWPLTFVSASRPKRKPAHVRR